MAIDPYLSDCNPADGATGIGRSRIELTINDDDDLALGHYGAIVRASIQLDVHDGTRWRSIIANGVRQQHEDGYMHGALIVPQIVMTGSQITGASVTGRFLREIHLIYEPRMAFADGELVQVRVRCEDDVGNALDDTYSFTMNEWSLPVWPRFDLYTEPATNPYSMVPMFWAVPGVSKRVEVDLHWGKLATIELTADDVWLTPLVGTVNSTGLEILGEGALTLTVDSSATILGSSTIKLGAMDSGDHKTLTFDLDLDAEAFTDGIALIEFTVQAQFAAITGRRLTGNELAGQIFCAYPHIEAFTFSLFIQLFSPTLKSYLEAHYIE
jgi:hypothetical protein